jgi:type VI protein secretion system component VasK
LELLEATLRSELGFKLLVEVEPELLQPQVVQPAHRQVRVLCLWAEMVLLVLAALGWVVQIAIQREQVAEVGADFPQAQQLGLLAATAALLLDLGCQEELLQEG